MSEPLGETGDVPREFQARLDELRARVGNDPFRPLPATGQLVGCNLCAAAVHTAARAAHLKWHVFGTVEGIPDP